MIEILQTRTRKIQENHQLIMKYVLGLRIGRISIRHDTDDCYTFINVDFTAINRTHYNVSELNSEYGENDKVDD